MKEILGFFQHQHLPVELKAVSSMVSDLAHHMDRVLPDCAEKSAGLRKLLEAKDCFVRAAVVLAGTEKQEDGPTTVEIRLPSSDTAEVASAHVEEISESED